MGDWCAVAKCTNYRKKTTGISYYRFPKDPKLKKAWVAKCYRADKFNPETRSCTICSCHFKESDFERDMRSEMLDLTPKKILIKGAIPSQNLPRNEEISRLRRQKETLAKALKLKQEEALATALDDKTPSLALIPINIDMNSVSEDYNLFIQEIKSLKSKLKQKEKEIERLEKPLKRL